MNSKTFLLLGLAVLGLAPAAQADIDIGLSAEIRLGRALPPPPPEVVVVEEIGPPGPPPWAQRHWYKRTHAYYYYPGCDVYYRPADRLWFYLDGGHWRLGARLPDTIRVDFGQAVTLSLESDRPYLYHQHVVTYYPANYFTRVKFKHAPGHRPDDVRGRESHPDRDHDRDDHGKGKGKGKDKKRD